MNNKENRLEKYIDTTRQIVSKLKELKLLQDELLVIISQAENPSEYDELEDSTIGLGATIDDLIKKLWILKQ